MRDARTHELLEQVLAQSGAIQRQHAALVKGVEGARTVNGEYLLAMVSQAYIGLVIVDVRAPTTTGTSWPLVKVHDQDKARYTLSSMDTTLNAGSLIFIEYRADSANAYRIVARAFTANVWNNTGQHYGYQNCSKETTFQFYTGIRCLQLT